MSDRNGWSTAFPIQPIARAVEALYSSWCTLAQEPRREFNRRTREPRLTRVLKDHVEKVTAPEYGVLGMWVAEAVHNEIDPFTKAIRKEIRTDIVYGWNNNQVGIRFVLEFKKLDRRSRARNKYLGQEGLARFVGGMYADGQPMAAMVGILLDSREDVLPPLKRELAKGERIRELRIRRGQGGAVLYEPSALLPQKAAFDTEHEREPELLAQGHDTIRVAHIFFEFGYA